MMGLSYVIRNYSCLRRYGINNKNKTNGNDASTRVMMMLIIVTAAAATAPGPRLNIKTVLSTYGDFHVKDKTAVRTSYL